MISRSGQAPLRVCIDARVPRGAGGIEQAVLGLASGLSSLKDGDEEYVFLTGDDGDDWLGPYLGSNCTILAERAPGRRSRAKTGLKTTLPVLRSLWHSLAPLLGRAALSVPVSSGTAERAGVEVLHFATQAAFLTGVPSVYQPWDLQHVHLPEFFSRRDRDLRDVRYRAFCEQARVVSVASDWGKRDLVAHLGLRSDKVYVVPPEPALLAYPVPDDADLERVRSRVRLPPDFAFYPAQTWAHKNHLGLLEALAILRDRHGLLVPVVCSGRVTPHGAAIRARAAELGLDEQLVFLGYVEPLELQCLYRLCRCLVFPSRFEGWGLPLTEALLLGVPIVCSDVTCLPEQAGDAALLFDPCRPEEIAATLARVWLDDALRETLGRRALLRSRLFTAGRAARTFRALYRQIAGRPLGAEDRELLAASGDSR